MCGHGLFFVFLLVKKIKTLLHAGSQIPIFVQSSSPYLKWFLRYVRVSKLNNNNNNNKKFENFVTIRISLMCKKLVKHEKSQIYRNNAGQPVSFLYTKYYRT